MSDVLIAGLTVAYDTVPALKGVTTDVRKGGWLGLVGPNGAGKTTLLRAVAGLVPFDGTISFGTESPSPTRRRMARLVAYVPQRPTLPESLSVADYVLLGRTPHISYFGVESPEDVRAMGEMLDRLALTAFADRPLGSLSGGESQRAVLARALAQQAPVVLLDEPTAALDVGHQQQVLELIDELRVERDLTVIAAMHDLSLAGQFSERVLLLAEGRSVAQGTPAAVLTAENILRHFGAAVRVDRDSEGRILIIPVRPGPARAAVHPDRSSPSLAL